MLNCIGFVSSANALAAPTNGALRITRRYRGNEVFTDLDFADDVAVIAETVEAPLLTLEVMQQETRPLGLEINWSKTKI